MPLDAADQALSRPSIGGFAVASLFFIRAAFALDAAPPGSGFSAWFPVDPKESSEVTPSGRSLLWVGRRERQLTYARAPHSAHDSALAAASGYLALNQPDFL